MLFSVFRHTYSGQVPLPKWVSEVSLALEMHWTERQLREDNTIEFLEQIHEYLSIKDRADEANKISQRLHNQTTPTHAHRGRR